MGNISFGAPRQIVEKIRATFDIATFVETGTYLGETAAWASERFERVITIEASNEFHREAQQRHGQKHNIEFLHGDSRTILREVVSRLGKTPAVFWLDAHWMPGSFGKAHECPVLQEIDAIHQSMTEHFILIDDARYFLAPPPFPHCAHDWPDITSVLSALNTPGRPGKYSVVYNDVIISIPAFARATMQNLYQEQTTADFQSSRRPASKQLECNLSARSFIDPIMRRIKTVTQRALRASGYELRRYSVARKDETVYTQRRHLLRFLSERRVNVVLDVGANAGQYARGLRDLGYQGRIVSFEPLSEAFAALQKAAAIDEDWKCLNLALGDVDLEGAEFHVSGFSESSSLLPINDRHIKALPASACRRTESVRVARLDSLRSEILRPDDSVWLKLDVQGFEKNVLLGATETLAQVQFIDTELSLVALYDGQPLLCEMVELIQAKGFEPISFENGFIEPQTGYALQVDGLFSRQK
jgi:FkbM family methyltransferase